MIYCFLKWTGCYAVKFTRDTMTKNLKPSWVPNLPYRLILPWMFLAFMWTPTAWAADIRVSPMLIELEQKPNTKVEFSFNVQSDQRTTAKLQIFDIAQQETGYMGFMEPVSDRNNISGLRVELDKTRISLSKNKTVTVKGRISIPRKAMGTKLAAIIVEEDQPDTGNNGISVRIRYAVVVKIHITGRAVRERGTFGNVIPAKVDGHLLLSGILTNTSGVDYRVESIAQIRGLDNRLIEKIELKSEAAWQRQEDKTRIFPGARVRLLGQIRKITAPGTYKLRIIHRLGKRGQIVSSQEIIIETDHLSMAQEENSADQPAVVVNPNPIPVKLRKDRSAFSIFTLTNNDGEPVTVRFDSGQETEHDLRDRNFEFVPDVLVIAAGRKKRVILKQQFGDTTPENMPVFLARYERSDGNIGAFQIQTIIVTD